MAKQERTDSAYLAAEARARVEIDRQLLACGWLVQDRTELIVAFSSRNGTSTASLRLSICQLEPGPHLLPDHAKIFLKLLSQFLQRGARHPLTIPDDRPGAHSRKPNRRPGTRALSRA